MSTNPTCELRRRLAAVVEGYDAALVSGARAATDVAEFARIEKLAAAGRMLAAGRVAETNAWVGSGHRSAADWLAGEAGTSVGEAAGVLGTGERLADLPATAEALRQGELSPAQARAVSEAAAVDPESEEDHRHDLRRHRPLAPNIEQVVEHLIGEQPVALTVKHREDRVLPDPAPTNPAVPFNRSACDGVTPRVIPAF